MKNLPLASIIIPVYNGANYVQEAIDSALAQTYKNIEIIVINDGSNDNGATDQIIKSYGKKVIYYKKENGGVSTALNLGIQKMKGDFFSWLSHDDLYYPDKISTQINYLIEHNLVNKRVITYTNYDVINEKSKVTNTVHFEVYKPNESPEYALLRGLVSGTALLIPKSAFLEYGLFDESYRCVQDYLLFFEFMKTYKYIFIPMTTNATRVHQKQVTHVNPKVLSENNMLWTKMPKELPLEVKIRLEGSEYFFYKRMYEFLLSHNNYTEAHKFSLQESKRLLKKELNKLDKVKNQISSRELLSIIYRSYKIFCPLEYELIYKKIKIKEMGSGEIYDQNQMIINKIIKNIGFDETIKYIMKDKKYINNYLLLSKYKKLFQLVSPNNQDVLKCAKNKLRFVKRKMEKIISAIGYFITDRT